MNVIDLEKLENRVANSDGSWTCFCPACGEEGRNLRSKNHLRVWPDLRFNCIINTGDRQHNARILQLVGVESDGTTPQISSEPRSEPVEQTWSLDVLNGLVKDYSYFESRGVSAETQKFFKIGVGLKGYYTRHAIIPILDKTGNRIIGFTGRDFDYSDWKRQNGYPPWKHKNKSKNFVWPILPDEIRKAGSVVLVESPGDVLYLYEKGIRNVVCLFGVNLYPKTLAYLISLAPKKILIATNNELESKNGGVGNEASQKIYKKLLGYFGEDTVKIALPPTKDFGDLFKLQNGDFLLDEYRKTWLN